MLHKITHPEYRLSAENGKTGPPYVYFERSEWRTPTPEQIEKYKADELIVREHGGEMRLMRWQIGGINARLTKADCESMIKAVKDQIPDYEVVETWNGPGSYSFSVSIMRKETNDES